MIQRSLYQKINQIMRIFLLSICFLLISGHTVFAQKIIQMDMFGKKKAMRFQVGDELRFKVKGDDKFYILPIVDLDERTGKITLPEGEVFLHEIAEIQVVNDNKKQQKLGWKLFRFGLTFTAIGVLDAVFYGSVFTMGGAIGGGASLIAGVILRWGFKKRTFKINERRQLRILDLNIDNLERA